MEKFLSVQVVCVFCGLWKCSEVIITKERSVCELGVFPTEGPKRCKSIPTVLLPCIFRAGKCVVASFREFYLPGLSGTGLLITGRASTYFKT